MRLAGRTRQGEHPDVECEPKDNLTGRAAVPAREPAHFRMRQHGAIRSQQRKALVDDAVCGAELTDFAVPAADRVAAVLHEPRPDAGSVAQLLQLIDVDVADAE